MMNNLPESWCWTKLSAVVSFNPGIDKSKFRCDDEMPFVPMSAIEAGTGCIDTTERRPLFKVKTGFTSFSTGDVLFAKITPCMENGKMAIVPVLPNDVGFGTTELHVLRPSDAVDAKLLYYFVSSASLRHEAQHKMTGAVGQKRVPKRYLETKEFPLPPLAEQRRIVEKIESLFTRLDKGEEGLCKVRRLLSLYRQSILKDAFAGRLVPQDPDDEPAVELLARIQKTRPSITTNTDDMMEKIELPESWTWSTIHGISETIFGQSPSSSSYNRDGDGLPFFQGKAEFGDKHPVAKKWCSAHAREAKRGDILISIRAPVGPTNVADRRCAIGRGLAAIRPIIEADYVRFWLKRSERYLEEKGTGTTFSAISKNTLNTYLIPVAPLKEQHRIVEKIDMLFAQVDKLEEEINNAQRLIAHCRQSILKKAFIGRLVLQDTNDEPASELLACVQKTRSVAIGKARSKTKKQTIHRG